MSKPNYEEIGKAVALIASLFSTGTVTVANGAPTKPKDEPKSPPADTPSTPDQAKADPTTTSGNSKGLTQADFTKLGLNWAKDQKDNGVKLKAVMAEFKANDGAEKTERLSQIAESDYDAFQERLEEAALS